jgi:hypothetical protein
MVVSVGGFIRSTPFPKPVALHSGRGIEPQLPETLTKEFDHTYEGLSKGTAQRERGTEGCRFILLFAQKT